MKSLVKLTEAALPHSLTMRSSVISAVFLIGKQVMITLLGLDNQLVVLSSIGLWDNSW